MSSDMVITSYLLSGMHPQVFPIFAMLRCVLWFASYDPALSGNGDYPKHMGTYECLKRGNTLRFPFWWWTWWWNCGGAQDFEKYPAIKMMKLTTSSTRLSNFQTNHSIFLKDPWHFCKRHFYLISHLQRHNKHFAGIGLVWKPQIPSTQLGKRCLGSMVCF
jgi:hypothetical protein